MSLRNPKLIHAETQTSADEQQRIRKMEDVRKMVASQVSSDGEQAVLLSDASLLRYLRSQSWNTEKASKMISETMKWRLHYKPEKICWEDVKEEAKTGGIYVADQVDKFGRPVLVMRPGQQQQARSTTKDQVRHLVYCLEKAISMMPEGEEQMVWVVDFKCWTMSSVSLKTAREAARVLQNHYPQRLSLLILYDPPKMFQSFSTMVKQLFEKTIQERVRFVYSDDMEGKKTMHELFGGDEGRLESTIAGEMKKKSAHSGYEEARDEEGAKEDDLKRSKSSPS